MSIEELKSKVSSVSFSSEQIFHHSSALYYAKDSADISFHIFWIKWHLNHLKESVELFDDVGF